MRDRTAVARRLAGAALIAGTALLLASCSGASNNRDTVSPPPGASQNSLRPQGPEAHKIMNLFTPFFWLAVAIGIAVLGAVVVAAFKFRARPGNENPRQVHGNTKLEVGWTLVPVVILFVMAVFTISTVFSLAEKPKGPDVVHITVTGKQWWWEYQYTDAAAHGFYTANEMHIPVGRPVFLKLESDNVIHSFWVPELNGKRDVVPGRTNTLTIEADKPGTYLGQCAEYCGLSHANMHLRVIAESQAKYDAWVAHMRQPLTGAKADYVTNKSGLIEKYGCIACHAFDGVPNASARVGPDLTHLASRSTFAGSMFELDRSNLDKWVYDAPAQKAMETGQKKVVASQQPGPGMPSFKEQGMTRAEAAQIVDYLLTLK